MPLTWQPFQPSDLDDLLRLMEEFAQVASLPWDKSLRRKNLAEFNDQMGEIWLIVENGRKIGYAVVVFGFSFEFGGRAALIDELYIEQSRQRSGIGGQTLDFISKRAREKGFTVALLEVSDVEKPLHAFYEKSGFARRDYRLYFKTLK